MANVFRPDAERLSKAGFKAISNVPVLFDNQNRLCREYSRYLRDRAQGLWSPSTTKTNLIKTQRISPRTLLSSAHSLSIWIDWCDAKEHDWTLTEYDMVLSFQNAMISGTWAPSGKILSAKTANRRADEVTAFLEWAAVHKLRHNFEVPRLRIRTRAARRGASRSGNHDQFVREGRAKIAYSPPLTPLSLLPRMEEVALWIDRVRETRGPAKYLAAKFILETGTRLEETLSLSLAHVPSRKQLQDLSESGRLVGYIPLTVTKGGVPREVPVALGFLFELRQWIDTKRSTLVHRFFKRTGVVPPNCLFLSEGAGREGTPMSRATLYRVFKQVTPRPKKWHPHFGRHLYACHFVLRALTAEASLSRSTMRELGADWINARGSFYLKLLQKNLGHLSADTTDQYLRWLVSASGLDEVYSSWHHALTKDSEFDE